MINKTLLVKLSVGIAVLIIVFNSVLLFQLYPEIRNGLLVLLFLSILPLLYSLKRIELEFICMLISLAILIFYFIQGEGDEKLSSMIKILFYSILFYFTGYFIGHFRIYRYKDFFINSLFFFYTFIVLKGLITVGYGNLLNVDRSTLTQVVSNEEDARTVILFWPIVFLLMNVGFINMFIFNKNLLIKVFLIGILLALTISIFFSTFSAVVMMLFISVFLYFVFIFYFESFNNKNTRGRFIKLFISITVLFTFYFLVKYIFSGAFGDIGGSSGEINQLLNDTPTTMSDSQIEEITNGRWSRLLISVDGFLLSPLTGHGAYYETPYSGAHSFIFDTLSFFGIFATPIFLIYLFFISKAFKLIRRIKLNSREGYFILSFLISTITIFISSILNPYLLQSSIDFIIFFCGGYISSYIQQVNKKRLLITT